MATEGGAAGEPADWRAAVSRRLTVEALFYHQPGEGFAPATTVENLREFVAAIARDAGKDDPENLDHRARGIAVFLARLVGGGFRGVALGLMAEFGVPVPEWLRDPDWALKWWRRRNWEPYEWEARRQGVPWPVLGGEPVPSGERRVEPST